MAVGTPDAPESKKSRIDQHYERELSPLERERAGAYYDRNKDEIDERRRSLRNSEDEAGAASSGEDAESGVAGREQKAGWESKVTPKEEPATSQSGPRGLFAMTRNKKGPMILITILLSLMGFGGAFFFGGALAPLMAVHNVTDDLNDQLSAVEIRGDKFKRLKFGGGSSDAVSLGCKGIGSALPIKCNYATISKSFQEKLKAVGIEVEGDTGGVFGNKIRPRSYRFQGTTYSASEFADGVKANGALGRAYFKAGNMKWLSLKGPVYVRGTLAKFGLTEADPKLSGSHEDRVNKLMNRAGTSNVGDVQFTQKTNPDGTPSDQWTLNGDPSGETFSTKEVENARKSLSKVTSPVTKVTSTVFKTLNILGYYDAACSVVQKVGTAAVAAKVANSAQLAEYARVTATMASMQKAGHITPQDAQVLQEFFMKTDARKTIPDHGGILAGNDTATRPNPNYGKNAMDSEPYKMSSGGGVARTSITDMSYSLGFGTTSLLNGAQAFASGANAALNFLPFLECKYIQSWWVRGGGLVAGIAAAFFSGGTSWVASASMVLALTVGTLVLDQIINAALDGSIIGEDMDELAVERGTAFWTGMSVLLGTTAQLRGMKPGTADEIVAYQRGQSEVKAKYLAYERSESNPLDISNPHSLLGTLAFSLGQHIPSTVSPSELSSLPTSMSSFVFGGISKALAPHSTYAASSDPERFKQCDDEAYKELGINADVQCNVRYVMPESSMRLDLMEVAQWMEDNGYVEADTTTGLPKGYTLPTTSANQNLAMSMLKGIKSSFYNDRNYGEGNGSEYGKFLDFCVYRVLPFGETYEEAGAFNSPGEDWLSGKNCMREDEPYNYFRMYTFDKTVNDDLDNSPVPQGGGSPGNGTGGGARISLEELKQLIESYGLPVSTSEGDNGYEALLEKLLASPDATWAATEMLASEKKVMDKSITIKEYLSTAWLWFENGSAGWPDPYEINCQDTPSASAVSLFCGSANFQVAGYQAATRENDYAEMYKKLYSDTELVSILQKVAENSSKASRDTWKYNDPGQQSGLVSSYLGNITAATLGDIAPAKDFFDQKTQFTTLLLGKDPAMVTALNSFAVSDGDLIGAMKANCGYGYICQREKQLLSNMIMALYMFDSRNGVNGGTGGAGMSAIWGDALNPTISQEFGPTDFAKTVSWYNYSLEYGFTEPGHTGVDYAVPDGTKLYSPVDGVVETAGGSGYFTDNRGDGPGKGELKIRLGNGDALILGHMKQIDVSVGTKVTKGQYVGLSGIGGTGAHVHVEYRVPDSNDPSLLHGERIVDPRQRL